jgi:hypothetical protein
MKISMAPTIGCWIALGIAWHLDSGFWNIFFDTLLGWIYIGFKLAQYIWP